MSHEHIIEELLAEYEELQDDLTRRRRRIREEVSQRYAVERREIEAGFAKKMHQAYDNGVPKMKLREGLRLYQSPRFRELWTAAEYEGTKATHDRKQETPEQTGYTLEGDVITFFGDSWTDLPGETLEFEVAFSEDLGHNILKWPEGSTEHAMFNAKNLVNINRILKETE